MLILESEGLAPPLIYRPHFLFPRQTGTTVSGLAALLDCLRNTGTNRGKLGTDGTPEKPHSALAADTLQLSLPELLWAGKQGRSRFTMG